MAIGQSGRIVIDLTPEQKKALHSAIKKSGKNLKQWFIEHAVADFPELEEFSKPEKDSN